jgi:hypothetical protein
VTCQYYDYDYYGSTDAAASAGYEYYSGNYGQETVTITPLDIEEVFVNFFDGYGDKDTYNELEKVLFNKTPTPETCGVPTAPINDALTQMLSDYQKTPMTGLSSPTSIYNYLQSSGILHDLSNTFQAILPVLAACEEQKIVSEVAKDVVSDILDELSGGVVLAVCEVVEVASIGTHFINFLENSNDYPSVGYDIGAIVFDIQHMASGECEGQLVDDAKKAIMMAGGWLAKGAVQAAEG